MGLRRRGTPQTPGWQRNLNRNRCGLPVEAGERREIRPLITSSFRNTG
jgi:hypothetical protein